MLAPGFAHQKVLTASSLVAVVGRCSRRYAEAHEQLAFGLQVF